MQFSQIIIAIDTEIARLQEARALLASQSSAPVRKPRAIEKSNKSADPKARKTRNLTPEGRKRIAEAVRRRWERQKSAAR